MSGVYARNRKQTHFDPVDTAAALQDEITRYIMNEKRIPKRWRQVVGLPLVQMADLISDLAIDANETWPDEKHIEERRELWRKTIKACKKLDRKLARAQNTVPSATAGSMSHRDAYRTVKSMDALFDQLFIESWRSIGANGFEDYQEKRSAEILRKSLENDPWRDYIIQRDKED